MRRFKKTITLHAPLFLLIFISCQSFTPSPLEIQILANADQLIEKEIEITQREICTTLVSIQKIIRNGGNRPADVKVMHQALSIFHEYQDIVLKIDANTGPFPADSIPDFSIGDFKLDTERIASDFTLLPFYSNTQLKNHLSNYVNQLIHELSTYVGASRFDLLHIGMISNPEIVEVFVTSNNYSGIVFEKITFDASLKDSIDLKTIDPWTIIEYQEASASLATVEYIEESGPGKSKSFNKLSTLKLSYY